MSNIVWSLSYFYYSGTGVSCDHWLLLAILWIPFYIKGALRISIITDLHYGRDAGTKFGSKALDVLGNYVSWLAQHPHDLVVDLGDRINDVGPEVDPLLLDKVSAVLRALPEPRRHMLGNHDVQFLSAEENEAALDSICRSHSLDIEGNHLVFWNCGSKLERGRGIAMDQDELEWLKKDLESTDLPSVIFLHAPLIRSCMRGNYYFERSEVNAGYTGDNSTKALDIIESSGKVILVVSGHTHWFDLHCSDGVHHVTIPSATESFMHPSEPGEAWASISIDEEISIETFGKRKYRMELPLRELGRHWQRKTPAALL